MSIESKEKKAQIINSLQEEFAKCSIIILTDYRGLNTSQITDLRRRLQSTGTEYRVVKNTLARFAAERSDMDDLVSCFEGPIAIAFGYENITTPAKVIAGYIDESQGILSIKGGFYNDRLLTSEQVLTLSTLPSRDILLARVVGQIQSPISALLGCLTTPMRNMVGVLQARINQLEGN